MARVNLSKAGRMVGVSRTTIHRYIKEGKLSKQNGKIDTSELIRVFGDIDKENATTGTGEQDNESGHTVTSKVNNGERQALQNQITLLQKQVTDLESDKRLFQDMLKNEQESHKLLEHRLSTNWLERLVAMIIKQLKSND